ncbi:MAG TPA: site-specific integrase [Gemmataceae bacterium]|nr:site-specific integrase [Gemmataceae bacterium]
MPRSYPHSHVAHGRHVGYNLKKRGNDPCYYVYFRGVDGRRRERDTQQTAVQRSHESARAIIDTEYTPAPTPHKMVSWDDAWRLLQEKAAADGRRGPTIDYYGKLIRRIRDFYSVTTGPADISPDMAETWKKTFSSRPTRRKKLPSPHSVFSMVRGFNALWEKWFVGELGICPGNPWQDVTPPKTDMIDVRPIEDETLTHFLGWLNQRFDGWELPRLFIETKAVTGCRLMDLCGIESSQLKGGRLHFRAEQTKGRKARSVPLPADLFARLETIKGPRFLWESYPIGVKSAVAKMGCPTHTIKPDFVPKRLYHWIETLFIDYGEAHPNRPPIHSHQLRKRAFTAAWEHGIDPRKAAIAIGCNPDTVMRHYVRLDEQAVTDEVMTQLAARLATAPAKTTGLGE